MVGEILNGRYEVLKPIGFGGMAEVYLARTCFWTARWPSRLCARSL